MPGERILLLNHSGHITPRSEHIAKSLIRRGYMVRVLNWQRKNGVGVHDETVPSWFFYYPLPMSGLSQLFFLPRFYLQLVRFVDSNLSPVDIIQCNHVFLLPIACFMARRYKAKLVYDVCEFYHVSLSDKLPRCFRFLLSPVRWLEGYFVRKTNGVVCIDSDQQRLSDYYQRSQSNLAVLQNVPNKDIPLRAETVSALRKQYAGKKIILYVGDVRAVKGSLITAQALHRIVQQEKNVRLLYIGRMSHQESERLTAEVARLGLEKFVQYVDWMPYEELLHYVAVSDVGLALYQGDSLYRRVGVTNSRKIFTYLALGLPVIAPDAGLQGVVINEFEAGLCVDVTSAREVADAILRLLQDETFRAKMGANARRAILEKYNWELQEPKLFQVYDRL